jgi:hypothetical protein
VNLERRTLLPAPAASQHQLARTSSRSGMLSRLPSQFRHELAMSFPPLLELENEILRRAAAYFARENVLPK